MYNKTIMPYLLSTLFPLCCVQQRRCTVSVQVEIAVKQEKKKKEDTVMDTTVPMSEINLASDSPPAAAEVRA